MRKKWRYCGELNSLLVAEWLMTGIPPTCNRLPTRTALPESVGPMTAAIGLRFLCLLFFSPVGEQLEFLDSTTMSFLRTNSYVCSIAFAALSQ